MVQGTKAHFRQPLGPYFEALPGIVWYQILSRGFLAICIGLARRAVIWLMAQTGHFALSTGDWRWLLSSWLGWACIIVALAAFVVLVAFDININLLYCDAVLRGQRTRIIRLIPQAARKLSCYGSWRAVLFVLAGALLGPLCGAGISTSLTQNLSVPQFIVQVIYETPSYFVAYCVVLGALLVFFVLHMFALPELLLGNKSMQQALSESRALVRTHARQCIGRTVYVSIVLGATIVVLTTTVSVVPELVAEALSNSQAVATTASIFAALLAVFVLQLAQLLAVPLEMLEIVRIWRCCVEDTQVQIPHAPRATKVRGALVTLVLMVIVGLVAAVMAYDFDELFPATSHVDIVAHRCGGTLAPENSVAGIYAAAAHGVQGAETDVQRTADGAYVINHDTTFGRLYGDNRRPDELTLNQVEALRDGHGTAPATLAELLDAAHSAHIKLYIELKGATADKQMVDDVIAMVRERDMVQEVALISLNYDVLAYAEQTAPEFETGYLYFAAFGDPSSFAVDDLIVEEGLATSDYMWQIHDAGKKVLVWTVDTSEGLQRFLASDADGIITDEVIDAEDIKAGMGDRTVFQRVWDVFAWE